MIRLPVPRPMRSSFAALWQNVTPQGGAYAHIFLTSGTLYAFKQARRSLLAVSLKRPSIFLDLLESDGDTLLDLDRRKGEIFSSACQEKFDLSWCRVCTDGGEEVTRKVCPPTLAYQEAMLAVREISGGYLSMKQLSPLRLLKTVTVVFRVDGATLSGAEWKLCLRHRDVRRPRVSKGHAKNLGDYPEDGIVYF